MRKNITVKNPNYLLLIEGFTRWLEALGYSKSAIINYPSFLSEFFYHAECEGITNTSEISKKDVLSYEKYLSNRKNTRRNGLLENNTLKAHYRTLHLFASYLLRTRNIFLEIPLKLKRDPGISAVVLTSEEVRMLYNATKQDRVNRFIEFRDRAILGLYYGCGLRRSEGVAVNLEDVDTKNGMLHVRKGKGNKERHIPFNESIANDFSDWISYSNKVRGSEKAFLLSQQSSKPLTHGAVYLRVKKLIDKTPISKPATLHTLRHSIATHLLQSGMELEKISQFLGHSSLESTQIYTHLIND